MKRYRVFFGVIVLAVCVSAGLLTCENVSFDEAVKTIQDKVKPPGVTVITRGGDEDADAENPAGDDDLTGIEEPEENPDPPHIGGGEGEYQGVRVVSVKLDAAELTVEKDTPRQLTATVVTDPAGQAVTVFWFSDNTAAITVDQTGLVTALGKGTATVTAKAGGKTASCTVTGQLAAGASEEPGLYLVEGDNEEPIALSGTGTMLAKALAYIKASGENSKHYKIVLGASETSAGYGIGTGLISNTGVTTNHTGTRKNLTITLKGTGGYAADGTYANNITITRNTEASALFTVCGNDASDKPHLILENITLVGYSTGNAVVVWVGSTVNTKEGMLTMKEGSRITGNYNSNTSTRPGTVRIAAGEFTMAGGSIDGNETTGSGGAVYCAGTFTMTGGVIANNISSTSVVFIGNSATFTKTGGIIYGVDEDAQSEYANTGTYAVGSPTKARRATADENTNLDSTNDTNWD
jgi:predicted outer membrane repeat protein